MTIVFQKSLLKSKYAKRIVRDGMLSYFKEKVLEHLDRLEAKEKKKEQAVQKALLWEETLRKAAYPVGTVREWKGKKYMKVAPGKWRRKYDKEGKGAKLAIAALKKKVDACKTSEDLLQLVLEHSDRFRDENGHPLPIVQELSEYVSRANDEIVAGKRGTYGHAAKLRNEFNARTNPLIGKTFKSKDGHEVKFTQESQEEMRSATSKTKENGFTLEEHFEAANQIKNLFESASLVKWHDDYKHGDKNLKIGRFLSEEITLNSGKKARVCITVKHTLDKNKKAIYSIEGMEITDALAKTRAKGKGRDLNSKGDSSSTNNVSQTGGAVKQKKGAASKTDGGNKAPGALDFEYLRAMPEYKKREAEIYRLRSKYEDAIDGYDFARYQLSAEKKAADKRVAERIKPFLMNNSVKELDYNSHTGEREFKDKFITDRSVVLTDKESLQKYSDRLPQRKKAEFKALIRKVTEEERAKERELEKQVKQIEAKARPYYKKYKAAKDEFNEWQLAQLEKNKEFVAQLAKNKKLSPDKENSEEEPE